MVSGSQFWGYDPGGSQTVLMTSFPLYEVSKHGTTVWLSNCHILYCIFCIWRLEHPKGLIEFHNIRTFDKICSDKTNCPNFVPIRMRISVLNVECHAFAFMCGNIWA